MPPRTVSAAHTSRRRMWWRRRGRPIHRACSRIFLPDCPILRVHDMLVVYRDPRVVRARIEPREQMIIVGQDHYGERLCSGQGGETARGEEVEEVTVLAGDIRGVIGVYRVRYGFSCVEHGSDGFSGRRAISDTLPFDSKLHIFNKVRKCDDGLR